MTTINLNDELQILGRKVRDKVTGLEGVCTSISLDLYGCVGGLVTPAHDSKKDEKLKESYWFDTKRLQVVSAKPVMEVPTFEDVPGPENKPGFRSQPTR